MFLKILGANLLSGGLSSLNQNKKAKKLRSQQIADAKYQSPEELRMVNKLRNTALYGDKNFGQTRNMAIQPIAQAGQRATAGATGLSVRQGLENSIIAQEMRSRIDEDTQRQISDMSVRLAEMNNQMKQSARDSLDQYTMDRSNRIRGIVSQANQNYAMNKINASDLLTNFAQSFLTGFQKSEAGSKVLEQGYEDFGNFLAGDFKIGD